MVVWLPRLWWFVSLAIPTEWELPTVSKDHCARGHNMGWAFESKLEQELEFRRQEHLCSIGRVVCLAADEPPDDILSLTPPGLV